MCKISKNDYYSILICLEALKSEEIDKKEKDRCYSNLLNIIKLHVSKR